MPLQQRVPCTVRGSQKVLDAEHRHSPHESPSAKNMRGLSLDCPVDVVADQCPCLVASQAAKQQPEPSVPQQRAVAQVESAAQRRSVLKQPLFSRTRVPAVLQDTGDAVTDDIEGNEEPAACKEDQHESDVAAVASSSRLNKPCLGRRRPVACPLPSTQKKPPTLQLCRAGLGEANGGAESCCSDAESEEGKVHNFTDSLYCL